MTISPLYMPDGSRIYVADNGRDNEGRVQYIVQVFTNEEGIILDCDDIRSGVNAPIDHAEALSAFASFIGAWVEAHQYGTEDSENRDLFPVSLLPWAEANADELWMMTHEDDSEL